MLMIEEDKLNIKLGIQYHQNQTQPAQIKCKVYKLPVVSPPKTPENYQHQSQLTHPSKSNTPNLLSLRLPPTPRKPQTLRTNRPTLHLTNGHLSISSHSKLNPAITTLCSDIIDSAKLLKKCFDLMMINAGESTDEDPRVIRGRRLRCLLSSVLKTIGTSSNFWSAGFSGEENAGCCVQVLEQVLR